MEFEDERASFCPESVCKICFSIGIIWYYSDISYVIQPCVTQEAYIKGSKKVSAKINLQKRYFDPKQGNLRLNIKLKV